MKVGEQTKPLQPYHTECTVCTQCGVAIVCLWMSLQTSKKQKQDYLCEFQHWEGQSNCFGEVLFVGTDSYKKFFYRKKSYIQSHSCYERCDRFCRAACTMFLNTCLGSLPKAESIKGIPCCHLRAQTTGGLAEFKVTFQSLTVQLQEDSSCSP